MRWKGGGWMKRVEGNERGGEREPENKQSS